MTDGNAPLAGYRAVDLSTSLPGALTTQFLADAGARVDFVEPPPGSPLRDRASWPALARGKRSVVLDFRTPEGRTSLDDLIEQADVLVTTAAPHTLERLDLTAATLARLNPGLVSATITGWGRSGPWTHIKGYEGLVMAKLGLMHAKRHMAAREGPAFVSVPYASWGAAQAAIQGILAALLDREITGRGQQIDADLVRGVLTQDCWNWFIELVGLRWPDAFDIVEPFDSSGEPVSPLPYYLLVTPTKDGHWLQFAQSSPRLYRELLCELGLAHLLTDPKWSGIPAIESAVLRRELWTMMLARASQRTLAEWQSVFEANPNIAAEVFRRGPEVLNHPQLKADGRVVTVDNPGVGAVRQPSTLVHVNGAPLSIAQAAPALGEHGARVDLSDPGVTRSPVLPLTPATDAPALEGVTIVEFGMMFAAPYGSTLLTDLGARVIHVETMNGDDIRTMLPFPEAGGAKVMQGKESIQIDLSTPEGLRIGRQLAARSHVVMQSMRGGSAERLGIGPRALRALNPDLVYLNAPGYGTDGPFSARPAYAPSIGAAAGFALADAPGAAARRASLAEVKRSARQLNQATSIAELNADGVSALGVASAILLGLLAQRRGQQLGELTTTMLSTSTHAVQDWVVDFPGGPPAPAVDEELLGYSALYRLYPAASGWVFLAAPSERDWDGLVSAVADDTGLGDDARFLTSALRREHDNDLAQILTDLFASKPAEDWEKELVGAGVGCVQVTEMLPEVLVQTSEELAATYCATAEHPTFGEHLRLDPLIHFSRSRTETKGGCLAGEHTDRILAELGYDIVAIADLRARRIVG